MGGISDLQRVFLTVIDLEHRIPKEHPLRHIKKQVDTVLASMSGLFRDLYSAGGRPSISARANN
jgi:hypothetical protein